MCVCRTTLCTQVPTQVCVYTFFYCSLNSSNSNTHNAVSTKLAYSMQPCYLYDLKKEAVFRTIGTPNKGTVEKMKVIKQAIAHTHKQRKFNNQNFLELFSMKEFWTKIFWFIWVSNDCKVSFSSTQRVRIFTVFSLDDQTTLQCTKYIVPRLAQNSQSRRGLSPQVQPTLQHIQTFQIYLSTIG